MAMKDIDISTASFTDPEWLRSPEGGGWLHANNVLFYFARSPFYDRLSSNNQLIIQHSGAPDRAYRYLATREKFETELQRHTGIQYVVVVDPLATEVDIDGPNGKERNFLWVIRKQDRKSTGPNGEVEYLEYYYIVNDVIYQAPSLGNILNYRMMNTIKAVDDIVSTASALPYFSATHGHTYLRPGQRATTTTGTVTEAQQSKAGSPLPEAAGLVSRDTVATDHADEQQSDERTLREALKKTMAFGQQYYDDAPLIGEPGNFRYNRAKDPVQGLKAAEASQATKSNIPSRAVTPIPPQAVNPISQPTSPNGVTKSFEHEEAKPKTKRKKSMVVNDPA